MAITSAIAVMIQQNQYVHPQKNPAQGPSRSVEKSMNDLYSRLDSSSSPIARITKNSIAPMIRYTSTMDGPARLMVLPDPMNNPVPMAPPMAISCRWRLDRLRRRCSGGAAGSDMGGAGQGRSADHRRPPQV